MTITREPRRRGLCSRPLESLYAVPQPRIKSDRVVPENLPLQVIRDILAIEQIRYVVAEIALITLVRVIRRPDERVLVCHLRRQGQRGFFDFNGEENISSSNVLTRL